MTLTSTCLLGVIGGAVSVAAAQPPGSVLRHYELSAAPTVILEDNGSPERQFGSALVRRLASGRLVVGDPTLGIIRVFERDGGVARQLARKGHGPGEMPGRFALSSFRDTVLAFGQPPSSPSGIDLFSETGGYAGHVGPDVLGGSSVVVIDRLSSGQYLVRRSGIRAIRSAPQTGQLFPVMGTYGVLSVSSQDSAVVSWMDPVVSRWTFAHAWPGGPLATMLYGYPFAPMTFVVASGELVWIVNAKDGTLHSFSPTATLVTSAQLSGSPRPFDARSFADRRNQAVAEAVRPLDSVRVNAMFDRSLLPRTLPWVSAAVPGPDGEIWLRRFDLAPNAPQEFIVVDRNGREIAEASVPSDVEIQQVGKDFLVGVRTLVNGTLAVVEFALRR